MDRVSWTFENTPTPSWSELAAVGKFRVSHRPDAHSAAFGPSKVYCLRFSHSMRIEQARDGMLSGMTRVVL